MLYYIQNGLIGLIGIIILLFGMSRQPNRNPLARRIYILLLVTTGILMLCDILQTLLDGVPGPVPRFALMAVVFVLYALNPLVGSLWLLYAGQLTYRFQTRPVPLYVVAFLPVAINGVFALLSLTGDFTFWIDAGNEYHRGRFYMLMTVCDYFGILLALTQTLLFRRRIRSREYLSLLACSLFPILGGLVQILVYGSHTARISIFFGLLIVYLNIQSKAISEQQQAAAQQEIAFLRSQANPHFIFNTLSVISAYCDTDAPRAMKLLNDFSRYLRNGFDFDPRRERVTLQDDLQMLDAYLIIARALYGERMDVSVEADPELLSIPILPLLVQPLVENAIQHGILAREEGGKVTVRFFRKGEDLMVVVTDNGVGMDEKKARAVLRPQRAAAEGNERVGVGLPNIVQRVRMVKGSVDLYSALGKGTTVAVRLPVSDVEPEDGP